MAGEYTLRMRAARAGVRARVNDLPTLTLKDGGQVSSMQINHLIVPGRNHIALDVMQSVSRASLPPDAEAGVQIFKDGAEICARAWNAAPPTPVLPGAIEGDFDAGTAFGAWRWQTAPPLTLPLANAEELNALLTKLHHALSARDTDTVLALLALKNREMAQAFGIDAAQAAANQREFFVDLFSGVQWQMQPLDLTGAKHVLYADKRVVHTLTHDDKEPLRSQPGKDGVVFSLPALVSHLSEGWTIVR